MGRSIFQQETQIRASLVADRDDTIAPSEANYETNPVSLLDDINNLSSAISYLKDIQAGNWFDVQTAPATLEAGILRGVNDLNDGLHAVEKKRVLRDVFNVGTDVTVTASQNFEILLLAELPANTTSAVGAVTTLGTVAAHHAGSFGTHSLDELAGTNALSPKNLMLITDASTGDPILSGGYQVYGLFQVENVVNGTVLTGTTPNRAQISFVRPNATFSDLEACPVVDIENLVINYSTRERVRLEDLNEQDFLRGAVVDVGAGSGTIDRQTAYDSQGVTPVDVTTNSFLDLEGPGLTWEIRDDLEAALFRIIEGSAGGTSQVFVGADVDIFRSDAIVNDFDNGASFDTDAASTTINVGVTANQIDSGGALALATAAAGDLSLLSGGDVIFQDENYAASTYDTPFNLSDASAEWDLFETNFGEVSLLNALNQAFTESGATRVWSVATANVAVDTDTGGPTSSNNFDTDFGALDAGVFVDDYEFYYNGQYIRPGANAAANHDVYPGTSLVGAGAQLKFEYKVKIGDQLAIIKNI